MNYESKTKKKRKKTRNNLMENFSIFILFCCNLVFFVQSLLIYCHVIIYFDNTLIFMKTATPWRIYANWTRLIKNVMWDMTHKWFKLKNDCACVLNKHQLLFLPLSALCSRRFINVRHSFIVLQFLQTWIQKQFNYYSLYTSKERRIYVHIN